MEHLNAADILSDLARSCTRAEDGAFWILTSAVAYLCGHDLNDGNESSAKVFFWEASNGTSRTC